MHYYAYFLHESMCYTSGDILKHTGLACHLIDLVCDATLEGSEPLGSRIAVALVTARAELLVMLIDDCVRLINVCHGLACGRTLIALMWPGLAHGITLTVLL